MTVAKLVSGSVTANDNVFGHMLLRQAGEAPFFKAHVCVVFLGSATGGHQFLRIGIHHPVKTRRPSIDIKA
jgi:hypothetical protein